VNLPFFIPFIAQLSAKVGAWDSNLAKNQITASMHSSITFDPEKAKRSSHSPLKTVFAENISALLSDATLMEKVLFWAANSAQAGKVIYSTLQSRHHGEVFFHYLRILKSSLEVSMGLRRK